MLDSKYEFISSYLKAGEAKLVNRDHIDKISRAPTLQDALTIIIDTDIGSHLEEVPINTFDDLEEGLWAYLGRCTSQIETFQFVPDDVRKLLKAYISKYDVHNIKTALHQIRTGKKTKMIPLGYIHNSRLLSELSSADSYNGIIGVLGQCGLMEYVATLEAGKSEEGTRTSTAVEVELSNIYYRNLMNTAKKVKEGFVLAKAVGIMIDMANLQIASRAIIGGVGDRATMNVISEGYLLPARTIKDLLPLKLVDVPSRLGNTQYQQIWEEMISTYNRTQSITSVEEILSRRKFTLIKELLSPRVLSPLLIVWYLVLKETELRDLRLVLKAVFDNMSVEDIRPYLVLAS